MNSIFLVFKTDGTVYVSNRKEDLVTLTSTALRLELQSLPPFGKSARSADLVRTL